MPPIAQRSFIERLLTAGVLPSDTEQDQLNKTLLFFATGLISITSMLWLIIYSILGPQFSADIPLSYQILLTANLVLYTASGDFDRFRVSQLACFLFAPFIIQWSLGNFINSSGVILWGLLAPFGAILCWGVKESAPWFLAWVIFTVFSGITDFLLAETLASFKIDVPLKTSLTFFTLNFVAVASIIFVLLRYSTLERQKISSRLLETNDELLIEKARSEMLISNMLPPAIAARLKNTQDVIADSHENVTVLFADLVGFTDFASKLPPHTVVEVLNQMFTRFDELTEEYGLEKIKTIGDAYMLAGGLNGSPPDSAYVTVKLALAMRDELTKVFQGSDTSPRIHIGISTGTVVAGVLGKKKFIYDLWGDTVNIANRITDLAPPDSIMCDESTMLALNGRIACAPPISQTLKGRGDAQLFQVLGDATKTH